MRKNAVGKGSHRKGWVSMAESREGNCRGLAEIKRKNFQWR